MPKKTLPRIAAVSAGETLYALHIRWVHGGENTIDVSSIIEEFRVYTPLRHNAQFFQKVYVGEFGTDIVWSDAIDMPAEMLWRLAQEQAGRTMTAEAFRTWRKKKGYTLDDVASALGISRRMAMYYEHGNKPIPRVVALATQALH